jgi:hypothetical protein
MNKLETSYRDYLDGLKLSGEILDYIYEGITFRLAARTTYTPDFIVIRPECIEIHEVKGFWRDDGRVKWKTAAAKYPWFRFVGVQRRKNQWVFEIYDDSQPSS